MTHDLAWLVTRCVPLSGMIAVVGYSQVVGGNVHYDGTLTAQPQNQTGDVLDEPRDVLICSAGPNRAHFMLAETPKWTYTRRWGLTEGYEHVRLLTHSVLMPWRLLDRSNGRLIWKRRYFRPDAVSAVSEANGIILAHETRHESGGGCYAISLENGALLWTAHGKGLWGIFLRLLDFLPLYANEFRDTTVYIDGNECVCASGRVLDLRTGRTLRRIPRVDDNLKRYGDATSAGKLYAEGEVQVAADGRRISNHTRIGDGIIEWKRGELRLALLAKDDSEIWSLDFESLGYFIDGNFFSYRLQIPFIFLLVSEDEAFKKHPTEAYCVIPNPTIYRLITLDLWTGAILQNFRISDTNYSGARIEDVDENGLLLSVSGATLHYYEIMGAR